MFLLLDAGWALGLATDSGQARGDAPDQQTQTSGQQALPAGDARAATEVSSGTLVEDANAWDGRAVTFTGEAIGECMVRGPMAWLHLNDDAYMEKNIEEGARLGGFNSGHAIWLSAELARRVTVFGDFKHSGDIARVTGVFNSACREHGGDMDIHATSLEVLHPGRAVDHVTNTRRALLAFALLAVAGVFYGIRRIAERRRV